MHRCELGTITGKIVCCIPSGLNMPEYITVVPYEAEWPELFRRLGRELRGALQGLANRIDHIGSTSVSGMSAKPILDIQISMACLEPMGSYKASLKSLGFECPGAGEPETPPRGRHKLQEISRCQDGVGRGVRSIGGKPRRQRLVGH